MEQNLQHHRKKTDKQPVYDRNCRNIKLKPYDGKINIDFYGSAFYGKKTPKTDSPWFCFLAGNYIFKVNNRNTRTRCEICSKLTKKIPKRRHGRRSGIFTVNFAIKIPKRRHWRRSGIFVVNFEHISHIVLVFLLLNMSR